MKEIIERILSFKPKIDLGFEAWEIGTDNKTLLKLVNAGILEITYKSNKHTFFKLKNIELAKQFLNATEIKIDRTKPLFSNIIGYDNYKELISKAVYSDKPIHILLLGPPATAKTLFLLELTKIPNSFYLTPYITYSGLFDILNLNPSLILIDQLDNLKYTDVYRLLIDLCEYGIVTKTTYNQIEQKRIETKVIATANSTKRIPQALLSRMLKIQFKQYTDEEFIQIANKILADYDLANEIKEYIIEKTIRHKDIRNVIKLANLYPKSKEEIDNWLKIIRF